MTDHYTTLGIPYNATPDEIRSAYFSLARRLHPDVNADSSYRERFLAVQLAYETLSNPERRAEYDAGIPAELRQAPEILMNAWFSRSAVPRLKTDQLLYMLIDMVCTADIDHQSLPANHVCLVLDRSTSMAGARMDMVKVSALNLLQQLRPQDFLSVVAFSDRAEVIIPPTRVNSFSRSDHRISQLQTGGGTEILQGLTLGVDQLRRTDDQVRRHLVLLTDGNTYGDEEGCIRLAKEVAKDGILISVLGIGSEWNDKLMDQVASLSGGNARYISGPRDLDRFIAEKLAEMSSVYARGLCFEFESSPEVRLNFAFRLQPNVAPLPNDHSIQLGDLPYRRSISILLEFLISPIPETVTDLKIAGGKISLNLPEKVPSPARILVHQSLPVTDSAEMEVPPAVILEAMSKLTLYRLQEKIRAEVEEGQIDKATRHLHYLATNLLSQGDRELAHTVLIEAEHIQQSRRFSGEGDKRIKYGTRGLLLAAGTEPKL